MTAHIVHVVHRFDTGGMENGMVNLFNALPPQRYRHTVVALTGYSDFRRRISAQAVEFHALQRAPGHGLGWAARLWKLLRQLKPDLVHTRNLAALEAQFVAAAAGIRATVHGEHGRDVFDLHLPNCKYNRAPRGPAFVSYYIAVIQTSKPGCSDHSVCRLTSCTNYNGVPTAQIPSALGAAGVRSPRDIVFGSVGPWSMTRKTRESARAFIQLGSAAQRPGARLSTSRGPGARDPPGPAATAGLGIWPAAVRAYDIAEIIRHSMCSCCPPRTGHLEYRPRSAGERSPGDRHRGGRNVDQ